MKPVRRENGMKEHAGIGDSLLSAAGFNRGVDSVETLIGWGVYVLLSADGKVKQRGEFGNLITEVGDEYYGERAAGIGTPPDQVTGMRLGTGTTAVAKTGAGAAIVTYVTASHKAIDGGFPTSALSGSSRRIQWKATWAAGEATANGIAECVITNETPLTNVAGAASNTIARALLSPVVNKGASDSLAVTWNHDILGA
jgi:hypothetical protein